MTIFSAFRRIWPFACRFSSPPVHLHFPCAAAKVRIMLQKAGEKVGIMLQRQGRNLGIMLQRKFYGSTAKKWEPHSSGSHLPNIPIIAHGPAYFHSHFIQSSPFFLMEHPILQMGKSWGIIKIQKRSESNVLTISKYKKARLTTDGTHLWNGITLDHRSD